MIATDVLTLPWWTGASRGAPDLPAAHARVVVDANSYIVTPGLIDINAHFKPPLKPDYNTLPYGVTTVVEEQRRAKRFRILRKR